MAGIATKLRRAQIRLAQCQARSSVAQHYDSFALASPLWEPSSLIFIDDTVTRGRTLLAAATRHERFPAARIKAIALVRTMDLVPDVRHLLDSCRGEIRWRRNYAHRSLKPENSQPCRANARRPSVENRTSAIPRRVSVFCCA
jgi:hypothetical protein